MQPSRPVERTAIGLQVFGLLFVFAALAVRRLGDFDLPWHLAFGRAIAAAGAIPRIDDFAFTHRPIQYAEFVADLLLYGVDRLGGPLALQAFGALCAVAVGALLWAATRTSRAASPIVVAAVLASMNAWLLVRPATLSFVLLACLVLALHAHRAAGDTRPARRWFAAIVPMQALWVNLHGFAVLGLALLWAYAGYRVACRFASGRLPRLLPEHDGADAAFTAGTALAAAAASMLNMAGPRLFLGPLRATADFQTITEWTSTTFSFVFLTEPAVAMAATIALIAMVFGREPDNGQRIPPLFDIAVFVGAAALGASAVRLLPVAAILTAPMVARRLSPLVPSTSVTRLAGACAISLAAATMALRPNTSIGVGFEPFHFPEGAVQFIRTARPQGPMWNFLPFGGYLIWRLHPDYRVLVDGRSAWVHDPALLRRVFDSSSDVAVFESLTRDYDLQLAVSRAAEGEPFGAGVAAAKDWQMVYWDDVAAVYVRRSGANAALARDGYRLVRHLTPPGQLLTLAVTRAELSDALAHDGALAVSQAPNSPRAVFVEACGAIAVRDVTRLKAARGRLASLAPGHPALRFLEEAWAQVSSPK